MKNIFIGCLVFAISGCSTLPKTFTAKNIMKVKRGMKSEKVLKMFGSPKEISQSVCGKGDGKWTCTEWKYGSSYVGQQDASFLFSGESGSYVVNSFRIDNGCSSLKNSFSTENIMKLKQGMKSEEILKIFGTPKNVSYEVCGTATKNPWNCTTWIYCNFSDERATFMFNGEFGALRLNNFDIER